MIAPPRTFAVERAPLRRSLRVATAACLVAAGSLCSGANVARAGPPFVTDDPEPVELRRWEFYFASQVTHTAGDRSGAAPFIDANYGAVRDLHLHVLVPMVFDAPDAGEHQYGYGDTEIGAKWRLIHESGRVPQLAIYPAVQFPTGDASRNLGAGHVQAFLPMWLQKSWGSGAFPWTAYGGAGYGVHPGAGNLDWGYFGVVLQRPVLKHLLLGGELFHQTATADGESGDTEYNFGTTLDLSEQHHLMFSAGRSIDGPVRSRMYFAYQLTTGSAP